MSDSAIVVTYESFRVIRSTVLLSLCQAIEVLHILNDAHSRSCPGQVAESHAFLLLHPMLDTGECMVVISRIQYPDLVLASDGITDTFGYTKVALGE